MPESVLYRWPPAAQLGRVVPKTKFYEHGNVRTALREKFVEDVQRITWAYKLAESTIRLKGTDAVPEIQVFAVETKGGDVPDDVLAAIDKSVHFPMLFEVSRGNEVRMVAAHKTLGGATPKVGSYFTTPWLPYDAARAPLPTAIDLPALYEAMLSSLLPVATRRGESLSKAADRMDKAKKLEREIAALERKLRAEPQLNRKIELRRALKDRQVALADLA
ncbi:DUF4391 domain-containing protein [Pseudoclavibacter chungangensis]|uniref:DUF4391 domain-containing protein n=1 Tax=Pseudoclavibacter chungangensis TaxID=587635 RepID=A0A7J5BPD0_9MICO|nr:DUF4391 domain-containing protein [Pseudoclavibacter chungangensis]KAB1652040.1 DUF4391 domain-containing protein [Pseudoclavibacter chungangensis]NYJ67568.1 hypothetical protein [Pseudoclavibacter chungangensis]